MHHSGVDARSCRDGDIAILRQPDGSALMNAVLAAIAEWVLPFIPVNAR
jgi:hypothetical protein